MNWKNDAHHYGSLPIALHWLTLLLLFGVYAAIELHDLAPKGSALRADLKLWHFALGLALFALVAIRLAMRRAWGAAPAIEPAPARWQLRAGHVLHGALYVFLVAMPLLGWLAVSAAGKPVALAGIELPALIGAAPELSKSLSVSQRRRAGRDPAIYLVGSAKTKGGKERDLRSLNRGRLRHPLFGDREHWFNQSVHPGWWDEPIEDGVDDIRRELENVLDDIARKIAQKL